MSEFPGSGAPYWPFYSNWGFYYLGPVQVPPKVMPIGMIDRANGQTYWLYYNPENNDLLLQTKPPIPDYENYRVYEPYDGPFVKSYGVRLYAENGTLNFEIAKGSSQACFAYASDGTLGYVGMVECQAVANPNVIDTLVAVPVNYRTPTTESLVDETE